MSSNYDYEPPDTPPWWFGIIASIVVGAILLAFTYCHHKP